MLSSKCNYALKAMLELAKHEGAGPITILDIANAQHIPARFLEAILRQLKQAGFTESVRGKKGGYVLAKSSRMIRLGDVIKVMEGPLFQLSGHAAASDTPDVFEEIWKRANHALESVYNDVSFFDLVQMDQDMSRNRVMDFTI
jgi:Rrf2 family transcriptional regulator, cysteine metabolism repressor